MATLPKTISRFIVMSIKISMSFFAEIEKSILKFIWKYKILQRVKAILTKKSNTENTTILDFKLYYRVIITKIACHYHKKQTQRPME
jgi:hypothetical protein